MFSGNASRLCRKDWSAGALSALHGEPTTEDLKNAIKEMATGFRQFTEELALVLGKPGIPMSHGAPVEVGQSTPDSYPAAPSEDYTNWYPSLGGYSHSSYWDNTAETSVGGQAAAFKGVVFLAHNADLGPVLNGDNTHKIAMVGADGTAIRIDRIYVEEILTHSGALWSALPIGSVILWAGSAGSIPSGWAIMDGTANAAGSGIDMRQRVPYGYDAGDATFEIGDTIAVAWTLSGSPTIAKSDIATSITVATPTIQHSAVTVPSSFTPSHTLTLPSHAHDVEIATTSNGAHTHDMSFSGTLGDGTAGTTDMAYAATKTTTSGGAHTHDVDGDTGGTTSSPAISGSITVQNTAVRDALQNHGATFCNLAASAGDSMINASLSGVSPTALRPAGKVLAFIERIA